jgi:hypothetical protein
MIGRKEEKKMKEELAKELEELEELDFESAIGRKLASIDQVNEMWEN